MMQTLSTTSARQLRLAAIILAGIVGMLGAAYYWFLSGDYGVLAKGIRPEQAAAIVEQLKKQDVSYELRDGGTTILVPTGELNAARLDVASGEVPAKGTVGFELFNQSDMGLTDFAQKVNYQRALQGEIARTIMAMDGIAYARVHIALPERTVFRATRSEPRAAVTLTPQSGVSIDGDRIAGIQRLVAATVPELAIDQVAVLNERGQLLTPEFSDLPGASTSPSALEGNYGERVRNVIASVAPRAHIQVKVTVMPRPGGSLRSDSAATRSATARDHSIRVVLFERSILAPYEKQLIQKALNSELAIDQAQGDQLLFSPLPEIAAATIAGVPNVTAASRSPAGSVEERFMANLERSWTIVLWALAGAVIFVVVLRIRRDRSNRRQHLAVRIREQLVLVEGTPHAA